MAENAEYSLSTQILMDFGSAMDDAELFGQVMSEQAAKISSVSEAVKKANLDISGVINRELKKVSSKNLAPETVELSTKLKQRIEDAIGYALLNKELVFKGNFQKFDISLNQAQQKKLVDNIRDGLVRNISFDDFVLSKVRLTKAHRSLIQEKFESFINTSLQKSLKFEWDFFKDEMEGGNKPKLNLRVTGDHMKALLGTVEEKLNDALASVVKLEFPEIPPIKVDSKKLVALMNNIREKISNIDNFIIGDDKVLAAIPNFDTNMTRFRENLRTIAQEITAITSDLGRLQMGSSATEIKRIASAISDLKATTMARIYNFIVEAETAIATIPEGTLNVSQYKSVISNIATFVDNYILGMLDKAQKAILDPMKTAIASSEGVVKAQLEAAASLEKVVEQTKVIVGEPVDLNLEWLVKLATEKVEQTIQASVERFVGGTLPSTTAEVTPAPKKRGRPPKIKPNETPVTTTANVGEFSISPAELKVAVIDPVKNGFISMLMRAGVQVETDLNTVSGEQLTEGVNVRSAIGGLDNALNNYLTNYIGKVSASMMTADSTAPYQVKYSSLHPAVRKALAKEANMTVNEFNSANPVLSQEAGGEDLMNKIMRENMAAVMQKFHQQLQRNTVQAIKDYHEAIGKVDIQPNIEAVHDLTRRMTNLQEEIVKKIKQILNEQFQFMTNEIRAMKLMPVSVGYTPSASAQQKLTSAVNTGAKRSVSATPASEEIMPVAAAVPGIGGKGTRLSSGGDTRTFQGAVINTMRYIVANQLMSAPMFMMMDAWESAKSFDYDLEKARQNFIAKDNMSEAAQSRVKLRNEQALGLGSYGISDAELATNRDKYVQEEQNRLQYMSREGAIRPLQDTAIAYAIPQADMGKIWQIASRRLDDPYEALALSRAAGKIYATERDEISPEDAAKGLEAIASQWGFNGYQLDQVSNMVIKTAMLSQATSNDILEAMGKSGGVWRAILPQNEGEKYADWQNRAFATGAAMQSLFVQATAASGKDAGTFWKSILMSPYQEEIANYLHNFSQTPGYERLDPYVTTKQANGREETRAKSGYNMFLDVIDVASEMRARGQEQEAMDMMVKVFKKFQIGGALNIASLMQDMDKLSEEETKNGARSADELIKKIQSAAEAEVDAMIGALANTWEGKSQRVRTMWETTSFSVIESFKPDVSEAMDTLMGIMRVVRDNAQDFANALHFAANMLIAFGAKQAGQKAWSGIKSTIMEEEFMAKASPIARNNADLGRRRASLVEQQAALSSGIANAVARKNELEKDQADRIARQERMTHEIAADKTALNEYSLRPDADATEIAKRQRAIARKEASLAALGNQITLGEQKVQHATNIVDLRTNRATKVQKQTGDVDSKIAQNTEQLGSLQTAYTQLGANTEKLDARMKKLNTSFASARISGSQFQVTVNSLGQAEMTAQGKTYSLDEAIVKLSTEFKAGRISAQEYIATLNQLNGLNVTPKGTPLGGVFSSAGLKGLGAKGLGALKGAGTMLAITAGMEVVGNAAQAQLLTEAASANQNVTNDKNTLTSVMNFNKNRTSKDRLSAGIGAIGMNYNAIVGALSPNGTSAGDYLAMWWKAVVEGKSSEEIAKEMKFDEKEKEANRLAAEEQKKEQEKYDATYLHLAGGAHADSQKTSWSDVTSVEEGQQMISRINTELGYNTSNYSTEFALKNQSLMMQGYRSDSDEVRKITVSMLDSVISAFKDAAEQVKDRMSMIEKAMPDTYETNDAWKEANKNYQELQQQQTAYEEQRRQAVTTAQREKYLNDAERAVASADAETQSAQAAALLGGHSQTSKEYLAATNSGITTAISAKHTAINGLQSMIDNGTVVGQEKLDYETQIKQLKAEIDGLSVNKYQSILSTVDDINSRLSLKLSNIDAKSQIALDDALLKGYGEDSAYYQGIERQALQNRNSEIASSISKLQAQADILSGDDRENVLNRIAQLQAESRDNLVKIYKTMQTGATFNIPSGIKPLTYEESLLGGSSEKSLAITQGGTSVTVRIDNVYGSTKDEVEKNIARPIVDAIRDQQSKNIQITNALVDQYRRRVGNFRI